MFHVALFEPEIPPNTGNIIRLCSNTGARLHLIHPLGFQLDERSLRRAGMDYASLAGVTEHASLAAFLSSTTLGNLYACSTKASRSYAEIVYDTNDCLLFGPESRGLPEAVRLHARMTDQIRIPMQQASRSLNLANAVSVVLYEAWRQQAFAGS